MSKFITGGVSKNASGGWKVRGSTLGIPETVDRQTRAGNTDILFVTLPNEMERDEIPAYLLTLPEFNTVPAYKAVIEATIAKKAPKPAKAPKAAKVAKEKKPKEAKAPKAAKAAKGPKVTPGVTTVRMGKKVTVSEAEAVAA